MKEIDGWREKEDYKFENRREEEKEGENQRWIINKPHNEHYSNEVIFE